MVLYHVAWLVVSSDGLVIPLTPFLSSLKFVVLDEYSNQSLECIPLVRRSFSMFLTDSGKATRDVSNSTTVLVFVPMLPAASFTGEPVHSEVFLPCRENRLSYFLCHWVTRAR